MQPDIDTSPICVDIETCGLPNAADYLEPVSPDSRMKDPEKIAASIAEKTAERDSRTGLDWNTGRIVAMGWWTAATGTCAGTCQEEGDEHRLIAHVWNLARHRTIVTFNGRAFDLPFLIQRSRYLGIAHPDLDLRPYGRAPGNIDLFIELSLGQKSGVCMKQTLGAFCKRFGIPHDDSVSGKDIAGLVADGNWNLVLAHVTADVQATVALAQRLGVIVQQPEPAEVVA